jgi:patatin-like phospholipase/acyl hydrolase
MTHALLQRLDAPGPKKILACDGGGILGLISVEILARIETELRVQTGQPQLVLADWFDFCCGTSTGAIIAACISAGMSMAQIRSFYVDSGQDMFHKASILNRLKYSYEDEPLAAKLKTELNRALGYPDDADPATLGDPGLRTLLMMVLRNHTTDSPWPVSNHPRAKYNQPERADCNLKLPLWQLVRASAAAPTFFPPEVVTLGAGSDKEHQFVFVDGGVTTYNNPAFLAFEMVTARPYQVNWPTGTDELLIVSVGTGGAARARPGLQADDLWLLDHAKNIPGALMNAASAGWDMACRVLGDCRYGGALDNEVGDLVSLAGTATTSTCPKQFSYVRYDPDTSRAGLDALGLADIDAKRVQLMDSLDHIAAIQQVGATYATRVVRPVHWQGFV